MKKEKRHNARRQRIEQYIQKNIRLQERNFEWAEEQCKNKSYIEKAIVRASEINCPKCKSLNCDIYGKDKYHNELLICKKCQNVWKVNELPEEIKSRFELFKNLLLHPRDDK